MPRFVEVVGIVTGASCRRVPRFVGVVGILTGASTDVTVAVDDVDIVAASGPAECAERSAAPSGTAC